ncbi:MAG: right-handed parallel beta-helix repeat-containing protein [Candidatus Bipolaricaulota bacterium]|nr:right-handed parallel beta-helix repeat-containing protein [Candidatus Bipolaricaulota bacterium]
MMRKITLMGFILIVGGGVFGSGQPCTVTVPANESLQKAIDAAAPGAVICLANGTWAEHIAIKKSLTLRGEGSEKTVLKGAREGYPVVSVEGTAEIEVVLENLSVSEAKGFCAVSEPQWICADGVQARGKAKLALKNLRLLANGWRGLFARDEARVQLANTVVVGNGAGVFATDSAHVSLQNSQVVANDGVGVFAESTAHIVMANSQSARNSWQGMIGVGNAQLTLSEVQLLENGYDGLLLKDSAKAEVQRSVFRGNRSCGIEVFSESVQIRGTPNAMEGNGSDLCGFVPATLRQPLVPQTTRTQIAVPQDFKNLQEAVDALAPGGTITLAAGTYETGVTLWKPLRLRGAGRTQTTLKAPTGYHVILSITADAKEVVLEGLGIVGSASDGIVAYGESRFQDIQVSQHGRNGIHLRGRANITLSDSQIAANVTGLTAESASRLVAENSQFVRNVGVGLSVRGSAQASLVNSVFSANGDHGSQLEGATITTFHSSVLSENGRGGLLVMGSARVNLVNSQVTANKFDGVWARGSSSVEIRQSAIENNGTDRSCARADQYCNGIEAWERAQVSIISTKITNNADWGVAAYLLKCGYATDSFTGRLTVDAESQIANNNKTGNHPAPGNLCLP